jgi:CBS domain-containing protein
MRPPCIGTATRGCKPCDSIKEGRPRELCRYSMHQRYNLALVGSRKMEFSPASLGTGRVTSTQIMDRIAQPWEQTEMNTRQLPFIERRMRFMPCTVEPSDSVAHARALLDEQRIKHLPVMSKERLVGIVSSHDLEADTFPKRSALAKALDLHPDRVRINSVMKTNVRTVKPLDNFGYAWELMQREHIGALPVLEHGRLAGIIIRSDLLEARRRNKGRLD